MWNLHGFGEIGLSGDVLLRDVAGIMALLRSVFAFLMMFALTGLPESVAAGKSPKAKITAQPSARSADLGDRVEFSVSFNTTTTATCQWRRNKTPLAGATGSTFVIESVLPEDAGRYDVVITNAGGVTTSRTVILAVNLAPSSLPVGAVIHGDFILKVRGAVIPSDGAYLVTGRNTLQDPEAPADAYTFAYTRLPKNKARMVINGRVFDADLGAYVTSVETYNVTFTGVSSGGELEAVASGKGIVTPPAGYLPSKLTFTMAGTISVQMAETVAIESTTPVASGVSAGSSWGLGGSTGSTMTGGSSASATFGGSSGSSMVSGMSIGSEIFDADGRVVFEVVLPKPEKTPIPVIAN